jgi:hypothetical protein
MSNLKRSLYGTISIAQCRLRNPESLTLEYNNLKLTDACFIYTDGVGPSGYYKLINETSGNIPISSVGTGDYYIAKKLDKNEYVFLDRAPEIVCEIPTGCLSIHTFCLSNGKWYYPNCQQGDSLSFLPYPVRFSNGIPIELVKDDPIPLYLVDSIKVCQS